MTSHEPHISSVQTTMRVAALVCALAPFTVTACSAEGAIRNHEEALTKRLAAVEAARETAAAYHEPPVEQRLSPSPSFGGAPYEDTNTLVVTELDIAWWSKKPVCARNAEEETTEASVDCRGEGLGDGTKCAGDVAALLRFGALREDASYARESAEKCAAWLEALSYVLVVHINDQTPVRERAKSNFRGTAVLVDLATGKAKGRILLDHHDEQELGGVLSRDYLKGTETVRVDKRAAPGFVLGRRAIVNEMTKWFPGTTTKKIRGLRRHLKPTTSSMPRNPVITASSETTIHAESKLGVRRLHPESNHLEHWLPSEVHRPRVLQCLDRRQPAWELATQWCSSCAHKPSTAQSSEWRQSSKLTP